MLRRWLWACAFVATVLVAALSHDAVVWAQGYGGVGFPSAAGRAMGQLAAAFCSITGCTMTGQIVFSGVTTDISTASGEFLTIAPAGAGGIGLQTTTGDVDIDTTTGNVTVDCTTASGEGCIKINHADTNGNGIWMENATGNNVVRLKAASASAGSWYDVISSANVRSLLVGAFNASFAGTDFANRAAIYSADKVIVVSRDDDVAAGALLMTVEDNSTLGGSTAVRQFSVDGNGAVKFRVMTSTNGATCNSANEGLLYYRVIDASNKSGFCMCARTASGAYGWKMGMTFGSSALTDGDC